ncbi:MAG: hypothetical protein HUJ26_24115 [Planctomycetaceae bacterium]|nr:hypothetical protein [Planctomycetaceae bacterium]
MSASNTSSQSLESLPKERAETDKPRRGLTPLEFAASVYNRVLILMMIYVLSIGPMYWQWVDSMYLQGPPAVARFYYPLLVLCDLIPPLGKLVNWYLSFWI